MAEIFPKPVKPESTTVQKFQPFLSRINKKEIHIWVLLYRSHRIPRQNMQAPSPQYYLRFLYSKPLVQAPFRELNIYYVLLGLFLLKGSDQAGILELSDLSSIFFKLRLHSHANACISHTKYTFEVELLFAISQQNFEYVPNTGLGTVDTMLI